MMADEKQCPHGEVDGTMVMCSKDPSETGVLPVWKSCTTGQIIVTPFWCRERCKLQGGEGHL